MQIQTVTRTFYVGPDGTEHPTEAEARAAHVVDILEDFITEHGGTYYDFDVASLAKAMVEHRAEIVDLLSPLQ